MKGGFFKTNWVYLLWVALYFFLSWGMLGGTWTAFVIVLLAYAVSITFALSPAGERLLRFMEGARPILTRDERNYLMPIFEEVYQDVKELYPKLSNKIQLYMTDAMYVNAFAMGKNTVAVTKGAVNTFSSDELKGVIAHEFGHIANGDTKAMLLNVIGNGLFTAIICVIRLVTLIIHMISSATEDTPMFSVLASIFRFSMDISLLFFTWLGQIVLSINSRKNEYRADEFAYNAGLGEELIEALYILQKTSVPANVPFPERMKASHPHLASRIARLERLEDLRY